MNSIKTKVKKVKNSVNQGLKIFFCVDDILNILEISKQKWNEEFNAQYEYVKRQLKHGNVEFHQYYQQNIIVEKISGGQYEYENIYCTLDIFTDILDWDNSSKLLSLLGVE